MDTFDGSGPQKSNNFEVIADIMGPNLHICGMIYTMEAKVGISKVEIHVNIGCGGEFWQKWVIYVVIKFETSTL